MERDILQEELKEMRAEKMQSDAVIEQLTQQLADANEKHNNQLSQIGLNHNASIAEQQEQHQQAIDDLVKELEQIRHQHAADLQTLQNEHEMKIQSLNNEHEMKIQSLNTTMEETKRTELMPALVFAVATPDLNETPKPDTTIASNDVADQMKTDDVALVSLHEQLEVAKNEIARLNELITASKVTEIVTVGGGMAVWLLFTLLNHLLTISPQPLNMISITLTISFPPFPHLKYLFYCILF